jgi:hypothetical protein
MKNSETKNKPRAVASPQTLHADALEAARALKRKHRTLWERDPVAFRKTIRKAQSLVFHRKPGPKPNPSVRAAARERGRCTPRGALYPKYISGVYTLPKQSSSRATDTMARCPSWGSMQ